MKGKARKFSFRDGGATNEKLISIINAFVALIISLNNFVDQIIKGESLIERWDKTIPFLLISSLCFYSLKKPKITTIIYAVSSLICLITTEEAGNLTGIVFLFFALKNIKDIKYSTGIIFLNFLVLGTKSLLGFSGNQLIILSIGYAYTIIIYYLSFHPKKIKQSGLEIICTELEQEDIEILQYLYNGLSIKEISDKIYLSPGAINKRIGRAKETMNAKSREHLIAICREKRFIKLNIDK